MPGTFAPPPPAVVLRDVQKAFDNGFRAVDGVSLHVQAGEFVALLGPSGCGKSTLLRLIAGLEPPTAGVVEVDRRAVVSYVFQDAHLLPWRSVVDNVVLPLEFAGTAAVERLDRAAAALRQVGLTDAAGLYPAQLSGGMRMRVSLARALVTQPSLLLLDEPFAALDEITRQQLDDLLRRLWLASGMTVLFVTHSIAEAAYLADRVVVFSRRPARVVLDRRVALGRERAASLRATADFASLTGVLLESLERGMAG